MKNKRVKTCIREIKQRVRQLRKVKRLDKSNMDYLRDFSRFNNVAINQEARINEHMKRIEHILNEIEDDLDSMEAEIKNFTSETYLQL